MSDEIKNETKEESKCFCKSKAFRKFLVTALGTFVGVYAALCLFTAMHRPPMFPVGGFGPHPMAAPCPCHAMMIHHHLKKHDEHCDKKAPHDFDRKSPFEAKKQNEDD